MATKPISLLDDDEFMAATMVAEGKADKDIARQLRTTAKDVTRMVSSAVAKLRCESRKNLKASLARHMSTHEAGDRPKRAAQPEAPAVVRKVTTVEAEDYESDESGFEDMVGLYDDAVHQGYD